MSGGSREHPASRSARHGDSRTDTTARAIVVAGMHRTGSSAISRVINLVGATLPRHLMAPAPDNELGFWEPVRIVRAHDELLASLDSAWDDPSPLPQEWFLSGSAKAFEQRLVALLEEEFDDPSLVVVKDPRICRLIPLWIRALERFGAEPSFVIPVRNPLEVAASLKDRNGLAPARSLLLWLQHVLAAERDTRGRPRSFVSYDVFVRDWRATIDKLAHDLGISWPRLSHAAHLDVERFLSPRNRHHVFEPGELEARPDVSEWVSRVFDATLAASREGSAPLDELDAVRGELERADRAYGAVLVEERQAAAASTQEAEVARQASDAESARVREELASVRERLERENRASSSARRNVEADVRRLEGENARLRRRLEAVEAASAALKPERSFRRRLHALSRLAAWALVPTRARLRQLRTYLLLRHSKLFEPGHYLIHNPDVARSSAHPLTHYVEYGWQEGRDPGPGFDTRAYLAARPDVAAAGINPLLHYVRHGRAEGLLPGSLRSTTRSEAAAAAADDGAEVSYRSSGSRHPAAGRPRQRRTVSVIAWDVGHNPLGRAYLLAEVLSRSYDVELVGAQFPRYGNEIWAPLRNSRISVRRFPGRSFPDHFAQMERTARELTGDVIVASKARLPSYELAILAKEMGHRPVILDVDDRELSFFGETEGLSLEGACLERDDPDFALPFGRIWTRYCDTIIDSADRVTVSNPELQRLYGGTIVPHARDERRFDPTLYDRESVRARLGLAPDDRVILFAGTPRAHKGVLELADALRELADPRYKLCVIGTAPDAPVARRLAELEDRVVMTGDRALDELPENMMAGDLVCLLQDETSEIAPYQMPAKFTDALAMGIPMIGYPVPPLVGPIADGLIEAIAPGTLPRAIGDAFERLDERRAAAVANRRRFLDEYSYAAVEKTLEAVVEAALDAPRPLAPEHRELLEFHRSEFGASRPESAPAGGRGAGRRPTEPAEPAPARAPGAGVTRIPTRRGGGTCAEDPVDIVFFWKQNDSGIYGRRSDMMVKYLAASERVRQVIHLDAPMDAAMLATHRKSGRQEAHQGRLVYENTLRRALAGRQPGKVKKHVFLYRPAGPFARRLRFDGLPAVRKLPARQEYGEYLSDLLDGYGVGQRRTTFWVCPANLDFPEISEALGPDVLLSDVIDDERAFLPADSLTRDRLTKNYADVLGASDVVLANSAALAETMSEFAHELHVVPNACEAPQAFTSNGRPRELRELDGPIVGYVGNLSSRIDVGLLDHVARARRDWQLVLVGSAHLSRSVMELRHHPNVHFLGVKPYEEARRYISAFDVAIVPHLDDPLTRSMNPLKTFVYASAGVPVVSTPVANIDELRALVTVADTPEAFVDGIEAATLRGTGLSAEQASLLDEHSWPRRVATVLDLVAGRTGGPAG